jgi:hypothetical protein
LDTALQRDCSGADATTILKACCGVKSPAALLKRASAFKKYISWFNKSEAASATELKPFPPNEQIIADHLKLLCMA